VEEDLKLEVLKKFNKLKFKLLWQYKRYLGSIYNLVHNKCLYQLIICLRQTLLGYSNIFLTLTKKEFERYGNRTVASFLRMVGAEMPSNSDLIKWAEQGRLHNKYRGLTTASAAASDTATFVIPAADFDPALASPNLAALRAGQTVMLSSSVAGSTLSAKGIITAAPAGNRCSS
jgi:hypothetical protein